MFFPGTLPCRVLLLVKLVPHRPGRGSAAPCGGRVEPAGSHLNQLEPAGSHLIRLEPAGSHWIQLEPSGSGWVRLEPAGTGWVRLGQPRPPPAEPPLQPMPRTAVPGLKRCSLSGVPRGSRGSLGPAGAGHSFESKRAGSRSRGVQDVDTRTPGRCWCRGALRRLHSEPSLAPRKGYFICCWAKN